MISSGKISVEPSSNHSVRRVGCFWKFWFLLGAGKRSGWIDDFISLKIFEFISQTHLDKKQVVDHQRRLAAEQGQELFPAGNLKTSLLASARIWKTWALVLIYFTTFGGFVALTAWLPTYWTQFFGLSMLIDKHAGRRDAHHLNATRNGTNTTRRA